MQRRVSFEKCCGDCLSACLSIVSENRPAISKDLRDGATSVCAARPHVTARAKEIYRSQWYLHGGLRDARPCSSSVVYAGDTKRKIKRKTDETDGKQCDVSSGPMPTAFCENERNVRLVFADLSRHERPSSNTVVSLGRILLSSAPARALAHYDLAHRDRRLWPMNFCQNWSCLLFFSRCIAIRVY